MKRVSVLSDTGETKMEDVADVVVVKPQRKEAEIGFWSKFFIQSLIPLILIFLTPNLTVFLIYLMTRHNSQFYHVFSQGLWDFWVSSWRATCPSDIHPWLLVLLFGIWAAISILVPVGKTYQGPPTRNGFRPTYRDNGFHYYVVTCLLAAILLGTGVVPALSWYHRLPELAGTLNLLGLAVCTLFLVKGHFWPSPGDHGTSGNPLFDFYWGMELYPRIGRHLDLKMWTNCRFGLMAWQLIVLVSWKANHELIGFSWSMTATTALQTLYLAKFYWWERGYMNSIDIILDRAGFYVCWGCLFVVPTFYTATSVYMVEKSPSDDSPIYFTIFMIMGVAMIGCNYWADRQRQLCGDTEGQCTIFGRPARVIRAKYTLEDGSVKERILLASGFWAISRHSNYLFEIMAAFFWAIPALFNSLIPYIYVIYLIILLVHRSFRDEKKCRDKYGPYWTEYCRISKYQLIPFVF